MGFEYSFFDRNRSVGFVFRENGKHVLSPTTKPQLERRLHLIRLT